MEGGIIGEMLEAYTADKSGKMKAILEKMGDSKTISYLLLFDWLHLFWFYF